MTFSVIAPPGDEQKLRDVGLEIVQAGKRLGFTMNPEGFLMAWVGESMRVLVDRDEKGEIVGILLLACGQRWLHNDFTASVLGVQGRDEEGLIDYAKNIAAAIGAKMFFRELRITETLPDGTQRHTVLGTPLQ